MSGEAGQLDVRRILSILIVILMAFAVVMFALGEYLIAGVTFLSLTFAIYMRETW